MASVRFDGVGKVYPDGTRAVSDLNLEISDGDFLIFVGPSGCGKTTALRMVAGLEDVSEGTIRIDNEVVNTLEPRKRDVAMVFQSYALYPHMSVFENIAFPLRARRLSRDEVRERVVETARLLGLEEWLTRRPRNLSGGQRQRVAMGRAIVRRPRLFLMDEPLSNLDAKLRVQMRAEIARLQRSLGVTTIYVTHDQVEAMTMGTQIAVLRKGVLQQAGGAQEIYDSPVNLFVATFIGSPAMNLFRASVTKIGDGLSLSTGSQRLPLARAPVPLGPYLGRDIAVGIRPEHLSDPSLAKDDRPPLRVEVTLVEALGSARLVHSEFAGDPVLTDDVLEVAKDTDAAVGQALQRGAEQSSVPLVARFDAGSRIEAGMTAEMAVQTEKLHFFDLESGHAIR